MNFSQDYNDEVYVLDNNPLYEDTTFIKIDIFDSISDQDHCDTQYSDIYISNKNESTNIVERKESKNKSASLKSRINNRITESLKRISKPCTSSNASDYESSQLIRKQLIEFINVLTNEGEQPKQIFKQPKGLRIKCKVKGKNIRKLNDYYGAQACKASRSYLD